MDDTHPSLFVVLKSCNETVQLRILGRTSDHNRQLGSCQDNLHRETEPSKEEREGEQGEGWSR